MRKSVLSAVLILAGFGVSAQSDYLITTKADTLKGELRILSYDKLDRVQISIQGKKEVYTALDVLTMKLQDEFYKPIQYDNSVRMMKVLKSGYLSLYAFKLPNQNSFDGRYLLKLDGSAIEMPNISFKKIMANYLKDCEEIAGKIKKGELGKSDINEIIEGYNLCVTQVKPVSAVITSPQFVAIQDLTKKITELNFDSKQDALDILRDMQIKVEKNEKVSKYLMDGLENTLKDQPTLSEDVKNLKALLMN